MLYRQHDNRALVAMLLDVCGLAAAMLLAQMLRATLDLGRWPGSVEVFPLYVVVLIFAIWAIYFVIFGVYVTARNFRFLNELESLVLASFFSLLTLAGALYFSYRAISRLLILEFFAVSVALLVGWRLVAYARRKLRGISYVEQRPVVIVGTDEVAGAVAEHLRQYAWTGLDLVGFIGDSPAPAAADLPVLGDFAVLREVILARRVEEVVIALRDQTYADINRIVAALQELPVRIRIVPSYFSLALFRATVEDFGGLPLINLRDPALTLSQRIAKRLFDLVVGSLAAVVALPVMALIALAIRLDSPGPILFRQERIGENGRPFTMLKFRSMFVDAEARLHEVVHEDENGNTLYKRPDDPRVTRVGRFIRRTSLDELPQLFNVLKGEMSLVGPRPEMPWLVEKYESWQRKRFAVPQGMTGWWQINGRSSKPMHLSTEDDLYYIQNYSMVLDIAILWKTIIAVLKRRGAW